MYNACKFFHARQNRIWTIAIRRRQRDADWDLARCLLCLSMSNCISSALIMQRVVFIGSQRLQYCKFVCAWMLFVTSDYLLLGSRRKQGNCIQGCLLGSVADYSIDSLEPHICSNHRGKVGGKDQRHTQIGSPVE
jgi:hypothetical protein